MAGIITTGLTPENLRPGIREAYGMAYQEKPTVYDKILEVLKPSDRAYEETFMMSSMGLPQVIEEGDDVKFQNGQQMYTTRLRHVQYGLGFIITQLAMEDGVAIDLGEAYSKALKMNMLRARDIIATQVYSNGFSTPTNIEGGDGTALFNNAHPTVTGNQSNVPVTAATLSEATVEQAITDISLFKDNNGQIINCLPTKLIIHPNNKFTARRILGSPLRSGTADNDINAVRDLGDLSAEDVVVDPYLSSTTAYFFRTDQPGLVFYNRKDMVLSDDNDWDTENMKFKGLMRFSCGHEDWRAGYGVNI
jgi:hypothetical protein